jgi:hypothetical protein
MADQSAPPAGAAPAPAGPPPGALGEKPEKLHAQALKAEEALEGLATMMGKADIDPGAIDAVSGMAKTMREVVKAMSKGLAASEPKRPTMDDAVEGTVQDLRAARGA